VSREQFGPAELAGLEDAQKISERDAKAVTKQTGLSRSIVQQFRHGVIRMENIARRSSWQRSDAGDDKWACKSGCASWFVG
jgi:hypothetical protein